MKLLASLSGQYPLHLIKTHLVVVLVIEPALAEEVAFGVILYRLGEGTRADFE